MNIRKITNTALCGLMAAGMIAASPVNVCAEEPTVGDQATINNAGTGDMTVSYDTSKGNWFPKDEDKKNNDSGETTPDGKPDPGSPTHTNGEYVVRIPTAITYSNMHVGAIDTEKTYDVSVMGVLLPGKAVKLTASSVELKMAGQSKNDNSKLTETTSIADTTGGNVGDYSGTNFRIFNATQVANPVSDKASAQYGEVQGTTVKDKIKLSGNVNAAGTYTGKVTYTASLIND